MPHPSPNLNGIPRDCSLFPPLAPLGALFHCAGYFYPIKNFESVCRPQPAATARLGRSRGHGAARGPVLLPLLQPTSWLIGALAFSYADERKTLCPHAFWRISAMACALDHCQTWHCDTSYFLPVIALVFPPDGLITALRKIMEVGPLDQSLTLIGMGPCFRKRTVTLFQHAHMTVLFMLCFFSVHSYDQSPKGYRNALWSSCNVTSSPFTSTCFTSGKFACYPPRSSMFSFPITHAFRPPGLSRSLHPICA
uniref:ORF4 n=1 Tax=Panagrellus redivivus TaxID=6233 RepID=A0A7E4VLP6_PANRE